MNDHLKNRLGLRDQLFMSPSWFIKSEGNRSASSCYILQYNTLTISVQIIMWTRRQFAVSQSAVRKETQESCCGKVVLRNPIMPIKQQQQQKITKEKKTIKKRKRKIWILLLFCCCWVRKNVCCTQPQKDEGLSSRETALSGSDLAPNNNEPSFCFFLPTSSVLR